MSQLTIYDCKWHILYVFWFNRQKWFDWQIAAWDRQSWIWIITCPRKFKARWLQRFRPFYNEVNDQSTTVGYRPKLMDLDTHEESKFWTKKFGPIRPICISNHFCLFNQSVYKKYSMYNLPFTIINRKVRHQKSIKSSEWHLTFWKIIKSDSNAGWNQNTVNSKNMSDKFEAAFAKADADGSGSIGKFLNMGP